MYSKYISLGIVVGSIALLLIIKNFISSIFGGGKSDEEIILENQEFYSNNTSIVVDANLHYNLQYYKDIADKQLLYMKRLGTNEEALFDDLESLNGDELNQVYASFGNQKSYILGTLMTLFGWYRDELSGTDLSRMKAIWNKSGRTL